MPGTARTGTAVAWPATLAATRGGPLHRDHLRFRRRAGTPPALHCFVLDCSASMLSHERLALAKGL
ncbi:magnesium chelatase, partial [Burkholderia sp. Ac-20344]|nr:magnesium chelatase [Burkholderia sp. Ac-20344]